MADTRVRLETLTGGNFIIEVERFCAWLEAQADEIDKVVARQKKIVRLQIATCVLLALTVIATVARWFL